MKSNGVRNIIILFFIGIGIINTHNQVDAGVWNQENVGVHYYENQYKKTGWVKEKDKWYYIKSNGVMQTGWIKDQGKWYYMRANGAMQTGWVKVQGKWYYMGANGAMQIGWIKVQGKWYYMRANGAMQIGWVKVQGKWYYMRANGAMQTGWAKEQGKWYYMKDNGAMQIGWIKDQGRWYYLYSSGVMAVNTWIHNYYVDKQGVWIQNYQVHTHVWNTEVISATCVKEGIKYNVCSCGKKEVVSYMPMRAHQLGDWEIMKEPTQTEEGKRVKKCIICDRVLEQEVIIKKEIPTLVYNPVFSKEIYNELNKMRERYGLSAFIESKGRTMTISRLQAGSNAYHLAERAWETIAGHGGPNIGHGSEGRFEVESAAEVVSSWESSNAHKYNILQAEGKYCGVAAYQYNDEKGNYWFSVVATFSNDEYTFDDELKEENYIKKCLYLVEPDEWDLFLNCQTIG